MDSEKTPSKGAFHPVWIFITIGLPQGISLFIFFRIYTLIRGVLEQEEKNSWFLFYGFFFSLTMLFSLYGLYCLLRKKKVHTLLPVFLIPLYIAVISIYIQKYEFLFPWGRIPGWMVNQFDSFIYLATFILPAITYGLFLLVRIIKPDFLKAGWINICLAVSIPLVWYVLFAALLRPLDDFFINEIMVNIIIVAVVLGLLLFYFFVIRSVYLIGKNRHDFLEKYQPIIKFIFCLIIPIIALAIINGHFFGENFWGKEGLTIVFGDFRNILFYVLLFLNGFFLAFPHRELRNLNPGFLKWLRFSLFLLRCVTFTVSLYFFVAFLPFFPFAFIFIFVFGIGLLIVFPFIMFVIHLQALKEDLTYLASFFKKPVIAAGGITAFLIIPLALTGVFLAERANLHKALKYAYQYSYSTGSTISINNTMLKKTLETISKQKIRDSRNVPYISPYFKSLVLDNLTLSDSKIDYLEKMFTGSARFEDETAKRKEREKNFDARIQGHVKIEDIYHNTHYDHQQKVFTSTISLVLKEQEGNNNSEYVSYFQLPRGAWLTDYYLYVDGKKVEGLLSEKKSVLWVYRNIRSQGRDPGILYFARERRAALKVFPFRPGEKRKTGFTIIHLDPVTLTLDDRTVTLGENETKQTGPFPFAGSAGVYLSAALKSTLSRGNRTPYAHFIVDCSASTDSEAKENYISQIKKFMAAYPLQSRKARISFAHYGFTTFEMEADNRLSWQEELKNFKPKGGFALDKIIKTLLFNHYFDRDKEDEAAYPLFIVVSDNLRHVLYDNTLEQFDFTFPESDYFYHLKNEKILKHSLLNFTGKGQETGSFVKEPVLHFFHNNRSYYVRDDREASVITAKEAGPDLFKESGDSAAEQYLALDSLRELLILYPEKTGTIWKMLFKKSLEHNILTPLTSFAVLENDAQREALRRKQQQILSSEKYLDAGEEPDEAEEAMPEPPLIILIVICFAAWLILYVRKKKKNRTV